jgi:ribonuclease Z
MTDHLLASFSEDIEIRTRGLEREVPGWLKVDVHEIRAGVVYDRDGVKVTAIKVPQEVGSMRMAIALIPGSFVVISGDTSPSTALIAAAKDVDALVHEVYPSTSIKPEDRPGGEFWPQYMREFHPRA